MENDRRIDRTHLYCIVCRTVFIFIFPFCTGWSMDYGLLFGSESQNFKSGRHALAPGNTFYDRATDDKSHKSGTDN